MCSSHTPSVTTNKFVGRDWRRDELPHDAQVCSPGVVNNEFCDLVVGRTIKKRVADIILIEDIGQGLICHGLFLSTRVVTCETRKTAPRE